MRAGWRAVRYHDDVRLVQARQRIEIYSACRGGWSYKLDGPTCGDLVEASIGRPGLVLRVIREELRASARIETGEAERTQPVYDNFTLWKLNRRLERDVYVTN